MVYDINNNETFSLSKEFDEETGEVLNKRKKERTYQNNIQTLSLQL